MHIYIYSLYTHVHKLSLSHKDTHSLQNTHTHTQTHALSLKHLRAPRSGMWGISNDIQTHAHPHNMPHIAVCEAYKRGMWGISNRHMHTHTKSLCAPLCVLLSVCPSPLVLYPLYHENNRVNLQHCDTAHCNTTLQHHNTAALQHTLQHCNTHCNTATHTATLQDTCTRQIPAPAV